MHLSKKVGTIRLRSNCTFSKGIWLAMRLTAFFLTVFFLQTSANSFSQQITFSGKNVPLEKVFSVIEKQTGYVVFYNYATIQESKPITLRTKKMPLEEFLALCFKDAMLKYVIEGKTILVTKKEETSPLKVKVPVGDVHGKVTDSAGNPIYGVTIAVRGTNISTESDNTGEFVLHGMNHNATLLISHIGYESQLIKLEGRSEVIIRLLVSISKLDEVQVIAYGTVTRQLNTGAISVIKNDAIEQQPVSNPMLALEGRASGIYIQQASGLPGTTLNILIRGQNSIASGNAPFYIIDGVPFTISSISSPFINNITIPSSSPFNSINPADIESIEILKDADATAIYGSQGANGVILITTKKGKSGKLSIDINAYSGFGEVTRTMKLLNTSQHNEMRREAFANDNVQPTASNARDLILWDTTRYTNWQKELLGGKSAVGNAQVTISGGNANTQFLIAGGYNSEATVFPGNFGDQKASVHVNLTSSSTDQKFKTSVTAFFTNDNNKLMGGDPTGTAIYLPPNTPSLIDSLGNLLWPFGSNNPYKYLKQKYLVNTDNLVSNGLLSYQMLPTLQFRISLGYSQMEMNEIQTHPLSSFNPAFGYTAADTYTNFANSSLKTWIIEPQANWHKNYRKARLDILIGATFQEDIFQGQSLNATGFNNDALLEDMGAASSVNVLGASYTQYRYNAGFGRINYNLEEKYILNFTARRDGSSRFGPGKQFANFGALGAAWIISKENWYKRSVAFLSFAKLKGSYGTSGNDQIGDYQYLSTYTPTSYPYQNNGGLYPTSLLNPDYAWEQNKKLELAAEIGAWGNRILLSVDFYRDRSGNQLVGYSLAPTTGFRSVQYNLPAIVQNTGWEMELTSINIKTTRFNWTSSFNISVPRNKLIAYPDLESSGYANTYVIGQPLTIQKLYHVTGVDPSTGLYQFDTKDANGLPSYPEDLKGLKNLGRQYYGGLSNTISFQNLQLDFLFQFVKQTGINYIQGFNTPGTIGNQPVLVLDRWQKPGDVTEIQKFSQSGAAQNTYFYSQSGDSRITDASFIRLKNLSLSYSIPSGLLKKSGIQMIRIYCLAQNLCTITKFKGMDPENQNVTSLPPLRVLTTGIQMTF